jgi:hypothetical protein
MPKPTPATVPSDKLQLYEKLMATNPNVKRKGATVPYTSLNGHLFSYMSKEGKLALRLPPDQREVFLKKYNAKLCEAWRSPTRVRRSTGLVAFLYAGVKEVLRRRL